MATEQVTEQVVEQVADHIEDVAEATRHINPAAVKYFLGGIGLGAAIGFFIGYRYNREKIKAEAFKASEEEIESIRENYRQKEIARENDTSKETLVDVVRENRYGAPVDTYVERPLPAPVPITPPKPVVSSVVNEKDKMDGWNFPREMASRTGDRPHIIHQDEFVQNETEFAQVTYMYYAEDDVLLDEKEQILMDRETYVPENFPLRFGHGTDDYNIVYVRNPVLELEIEICRSPGSYEEQVLGLEREPHNDAAS